MTSCKIVNETNVTKIADFDLHTKEGPATSCTSAADALPKSPLFYGKCPKGKPYLALMSYQQFEMAKGTVIGMTVTAGVLGIASIVLAVMLYKNKRKL